MNRKNCKLAIVRGLPGSGKSTVSKKIAKKYNLVHLENDMFLYNGNKYIFSPERAKLAALKCFKAVKKSLMNGKSTIVSNVFVTKKTIDKYVDLAKYLDIKYHIFRMATQYKSLHNVPDNILDSMENSFENYPGESLIYDLE